jgi:hypothetical protein
MHIIKSSLVDRDTILYDLSKAENLVVRRETMLSAIVETWHSTFVQPFVRHALRLGSSMSKPPVIGIRWDCFSGKPHSPTRQWSSHFLHSRGWGVLSIASPHTVFVNPLLDKRVSSILFIWFYRRRSRQAQPKGH